MLLDDGLATELIGDPASHHPGGFEAFGVNVMQSDGGPAKLQELQDICEQVLGEDDAAGADESDPGYVESFSVLDASRRFRAVSRKQTPENTRSRRFMSGSLEEGFAKREVPFGQREIQ